MKGRHLSRGVLLIAVCLAVAAPSAWAHEISGANASFVAGMEGTAVAPFTYLGAKHMVTGYDHVLFLIGVVFFLHHLRAVVLYVTLFTLGHSATLLAGVLGGWVVNTHIVDAVIGLSVVYKAFENIGGFEASWGAAPDPRIAVFAFGLCHGLGLATKLLSLAPSEQGLAVNLVSFNVGVELGQIAVLALVVVLLNAWRTRPSFGRYAFAANVLLMAGGFLLAGQHVANFLLMSR